MAIGKILRAAVPGALLRWGAKLRFPYLFLLTAVLFVFDLAIPDIVPFADEIIIGLTTLILANLKKERSPSDDPAPTNDEHRG